MSDNPSPPTPVERLKQLRHAIHAVNRNPIPNRCRIEWREELDRIIAAMEAAPSHPDAGAMAEAPDDHETIWLAPACNEGCAEGRLWAPDNPWGDKCEDCDEKPVKYVRADLVTRREAAGFARGVEQTLDAMVEGLPTAMAEQWTEWCDDTGCFPDDFEWKGRPKLLWFNPGKWTRKVGDALHYHAKAMLKKKANNDATEQSQGTGASHAHVR